MTTALAFANEIMQMRDRINELLQENNRLRAATPSLRIEAGKTYCTRSGTTAYITATNSAKMLSGSNWVIAQPVEGRYTDAYGRESVGHWCSDGSFVRAGTPHAFDLVGESTTQTPAPSLPKQYPKVGERKPRVGYEDDQGAVTVRTVYVDQAVWERTTYEIAIPYDVPIDDEEEYVRNQIDNAHAMPINGPEFLETIGEHGCDYTIMRNP